MNNIKYINVNEELESFWRHVIKQSRANLTRQGINSSKDLYKSLDYELTVSENSIDTDFIMEDYGDFIDKGVKGVESGRSLSNYRYTNKKPPIKDILKWMRVKPIKARNRKTGRFQEQKQGAFAIQNAIYKKGIKPTEFFSRPFEVAFNDLPDELIEAYGLDVDQFMNFVLNK